MTWIKVGTLPGFDFPRAMRGEEQKQAGIPDKSWSTLSKAVQSVAVDHFLNIVLSLDPHPVVVLLSIDNQENVSELSNPEIYLPGLFKNAPEQRSRFEVWMTLCKCCSAGVYFDAE